MKKILFIIILGGLGWNQSIAQNNDNFENEMEDLTKELEKAMKSMEQLFGENLIMRFDTMSFKDFGINPEDMEHQFGDINIQELDMNEMMKLMEEQMKGVDMSMFNEFFKDLELQFPELNTPENLDQPSEEEGQPTKKKKKRKVYKL